MILTPHNEGATGVALFIDIENFVSTAATAALPLDLGPVISKLKETGPVRLCRSFGDLSKALTSLNRGREFDSIRKMLYKNLVEIIDIPYMTANKNTADIQLVLDVISHAYQNPQLTHFAILSSDRDYVPLFRKLRELGKSVIAVAVDQAYTNDMMRESSDFLYYYSALVAPAMSSDPADVELSFEKSLLPSYYDVLRRAVQALEDKGKRAIGTEVAQQMRALRSDFNPALVGCLSFKDFAELAKAAGAIETEFPTGPGDIVLRLAKPRVMPSTIASRIPARDVPIAGAVLDGPDVSGLRNELKDLLKVSLPSIKKRKAIVSEIEDAYDRLIHDGSFELNMLSDTVYKDLQPKGFDSGTIHKMVMSLYLSRCFHCETDVPNGMKKNNPTITGLAKPADEWHDRIHLNFIRQLRNRGHRPTPEQLATLFYEESAKEHISEMRRLMEEV